MICFARVCIPIHTALFFANVVIVGLCVVEHKLTTERSMHLVQLSRSIAKRAAEA